MKQADEVWSYIHLHPKGERSDPSRYSTVGFPQKDSNLSFNKVMVKPMKKYAVTRDSLRQSVEQAKLDASKSAYQTIKPMKSEQKRLDGPIYFQGKRYETWEEYKAARDRPEGSAVEHPPHYNEHPSGVECLDIIRHMNFNLGNVIKYVWRADLKEDAIQDLEKAVFYLKDEIQRRTHKEG